MAEVKWTERSLRDIEQIAEYISKDSVIYAKTVVKRILEVEEILEEFPLAGR